MTSVHALLLDRRHRIAVRAFALPLHALLLPVLAGEHGDLVGHHEGGVEAHAELADDANVLRFILLHLALELVGAGLGDDAEVVLRLRHRHADAVITHGDGARLFIDDEINAEVLPVESDLLIRQTQVAELVDGVGRVGDDLTQKDLLVGIDGIDHQVKEPLALGLELFFAHVRNCLQAKSHNGIL